MTTTKIRQSGFQAMPDERRGSQQADDTTGSHRTGADIKHIGVSHIVRSHVRNRHVSGRNCAGNSLAEKFDSRDQDKVREHPSSAHERSDARTDNVSDTEKRRIDLDLDGTAFEWGPEHLCRDFLPGVKRL